jgi:hypothetical protein
MMNLKPKRKTTADDVRRVALAALISALDEGKQEVTKTKSGLTPVRAVATGAAVYTAGRAAYRSQRFVREQLANLRNHDRDDEEPEAEEEFDEEEDLEEDEEQEEPEAEEDLEEDEEQEEPEAEEDLEEDEEQEQPEAEEDLEEDEEQEQPEARKDEGDEEDDDRGDDGGPTDEDEPEPDRGPEGSDEAEPEAEEDSGEPEADGRDDVEDEERPPTPDLRPVRRAARKKGKQPSLSLPERPSRSRSPVSRA